MLSRLFSKKKADLSVGLLQDEKVADAKKEADEAKAKLEHATKQLEQLPRLIYAMFQDMNNGYSNEKMECIKTLFQEYSAVGGNLSDFENSVDVIKSGATRSLVLLYLKDTKLGANIAEVQERLRRNSYSQ
jgi:hypothetical protein